MLFNKKGGLLLAGLAAYAYYRYSKLTPEQKKDLTTKIKDQGKKWYDQIVPGNLKSSFEGSRGNNSHSNFEGSQG